ncbi:MAG: NAD(P)/FAD-dependent oxidoreductase [Boseongicola sp.]
MKKVAIIGGGIAGVSAAAELAPNTECTLFEQEPVLGYHASGRSAAMFEENYGNTVVRALNTASKATHVSAEVLSPRGLMMVALKGEEAIFENDCAQMNLHSIPLSEAHDRVPILHKDIILAALHEGASDLDTDKLLQGYARAARSAGAEFRLGELVSVHQIKDGWVMKSNTSESFFDVVVNAAGPWADSVAESAGIRPVGLVPLRRSMARIPAPGGHDVQGWPMLFGPDESWYAKPDAGGWVVSPAEEHPVEPMDAWADDLVLAEGIARYEAHVSEPVTRVETSWAGLRTFAPDRTPVIGEDPSHGGFFWLAGQGGYGFQTAPAAAKLIADLVLNRKPQIGNAIVSALSPARLLE